SGTSPSPDHPHRCMLSRPQVSRGGDDGVTPPTHPPLLLWEGNGEHTMTMMRAMTMPRAGGPEVLTPADIPRPVRVNAEVLVRVVAAGVNPIDAKTRAGRGVFAGIASFPAVLGNDFSGVVVEAPFESHPLQPGTEVYGMG